MSEPGQAVVIDNSDVDFTADGTWLSGTGVPGYYGDDYLYAYKGNGSLTATWTYQVASSGGYQIYAQWSAYSNRAPDAPYRIYNNGSLLATVRADQRTNGGQFNLLGSFVLNTGTVDIVLSNDASELVVADAVQIVSVEVRKLCGS